MMGKGRIEHFRVSPSWYSGLGVEINGNWED